MSSIASFENKIELLPARERYKIRQEALGKFAKKSLGQNYLVNDHVILKIIRSVIEQNPQNIIEIGPGLGGLTDGLLQLKPNKFVVIELDKTYAHFWRQVEQLEVHEDDALKWDWSQTVQLKDLVLVSNLPYQISSSVVVERCIDDLSELKAMVLMFQKEVAIRIRAEHGASEYGFLSVLSQTFWSISKVCDAGPKDFDPAPKVASRVLLFKKKPSSEIENKKKFLKFLKAAFLHPRKTMMSNLVSLGDVQKSTLELVFKSNQWDFMIRPHQISVVQFARLYRQIYFDRE